MPASGIAGAYGRQVLSSAVGDGTPGEVHSGKRSRVRLKGGSKLRGDRQPEERSWHRGHSRCRRRKANTRWARPETAKVERGRAEPVVALAIRRGTSERDPKSRGSVARATADREAPALQPTPLEGQSERYPTRCHFFSNRNGPTRESRAVSFFSPIRFGARAHR